jgi:hypothetical protein
MTIHTMLDCETMGTAPGCAILSIGMATWNDAFAPGFGFQTLDVRIDLASCLLAGLAVEPGTLAWWRSQEDAAKAALVDGASQSLDAALALVTTHWQQTGSERLWANGPAADAAWLEAAYRACGKKAPWSYRDVRCYRTIVDLAGLGREQRAKPAIAHVAVADAVAQATDVHACLRRIGGA